MTSDVEVILKDECYQIVGAAMEVHSILGCGFTEPIYQEAMEIELSLRNIPFLREDTLNISYKGHTLKKNFRPDFICFDKIIVELKALDTVTEEHISQVYNYLKASNLQLGLLINFGNKSLSFKRIVPKSTWKE